MKSKYTIILGIFIAFIPFFPIIFIGWPLSFLGNCTVNESQVYPCVILGKDFGELLFSIGVSGWFFLFTFPIGGFIILIGIIQSFVSKYRNK